MRVTIENNQQEQWTIMVTDLKVFVAVSIPSMFLFGMRHALDVDHITAIDNLVRMHNARKRGRWVGTGFSMGHMISILSEMLLIIFVVGSATSGKFGQLSFWSGVMGAIALATIGAINIYSMKKWGKTGSGILASKIVARTHILGPFGSALVTNTFDSYSFGNNNYCWRFRICFCNKEKEGIRSIYYYLFSQL